MFDKLHPKPPPRSMKSKKNGKTKKKSDKALDYETFKFPTRNDKGEMIYNRDHYSITYPPKNITQIKQIVESKKTNP